MLKHDRSHPIIGFIGFGKVASAFSARLSSHGFEVLAYDINIYRSQGLKRLRERAASADVRFMGMADMVRGCEVIILVVPPQGAWSMTVKAAKFLRPGQIFIDATSVGPGEKKRLSEIVAARGSAFIDAAIMEGIGLLGADARILVCGRKAKSVARTLQFGGLNAHSFRGVVGDSAQIKLLRSIFSKGAEALLLETLLASRSFGLEIRILEELRAIFDRGFSVAVEWLITHPTACSRRYAELIQIQRMLSQTPVVSIMTPATKRFFRRSKAIVPKPPEGKAPATVKAAVEMLAANILIMNEAKK